MVFEAAEYADRTARTQHAMADEDIAALLLTSEPDVRYYTGFLTRFWESPTRPWFVVIPAAGKPIAVIPAIGGDLMATTWIEDIRTWPAPHPEDDGVSLLADTLRETAGRARRIGLPMGHETSLRMPLADFHRLTEKLAPAGFVDATGIVQSVQLLKSDAEITAIAAICRIADAAFGEVAGFAHVGTPLAEIFRSFQIALLKNGADWVPCLAGGAGPGGYADVISPASPRALAPGDVLMLDTGAVRDGYFCDFDRNYAIRTATDETRDAYRLLFEATEAGFAAARPGATTADLYEAMQAVIARGGDAGAGGRLGHGLGMRLTEWPSLIPTDQTVLAPGMVLTLEPGLEIAPGRIMVHEENIVIREAGAELLSTRATPEIPILDGSS